VSSTLPYLVFGAPKVGECEIAELIASLRSGWIGTGPKVKQFEQMIAEYTDAEHAVATSSGTAALHLALSAVQVEGGEVITTPMTFAATANAIIHAGARPVFVDCNRSTQLIEAEQIEAAITSQTRAIVPVHFAGRVCDQAGISDVARRHGLVVIDDAAHALEARGRVGKVGAISHLTCFSFYVTKNITTGEGGMVTTNDADLADRIRLRGHHGMSKDAWKRFSAGGYRHYQICEPGYKYNLTDLAASIGIHQFPNVSEWLARREEIWCAYDEAFRDLPVETPPPTDPCTVHSRHLYTLMVDVERCACTRDEFMARLHQQGIGSGVHYVGVHLQPYYRCSFGLTPSDFPNATWISERTVSVPLSPHLTDSDVERVIGAVRQALA
jgi:dTDP-4-amino-4,6-dideoxygalactose transaminase